MPFFEYICKWTGCPGADTNVTTATPTTRRTYYWRTYYYYHVQRMQVQATPLVLQQEVPLAAPPALQRYRRASSSSI